MNFCNELFSNPKLKVSVKEYQNLNFFSMKILHPIVQTTAHYRVSSRIFQSQSKVQFYETSNFALISETKIQFWLIEMI